MKFAKTKKEEKPLVKDDDSDGTKYFYFTNMMKSSQAFFISMMDSPQPEFDEEHYEIFVTKIPTKHRNTPEVIAAKQAEYENYVKSSLAHLKKLKTSAKRNWRCNGSV